MELDDIFTTAEAVEYCEVSEATFSNHVHNMGILVPLLLNTEGRGFGKGSGGTHFYTRRMLNIYKLAYKKGGIGALQDVSPIAPTEEEKASVYSGKLAAEYLGKNYNTFRVQVRNGLIRHKRSSNISVFLKRDLDEFKARPDGRRVKVVTQI